MGGSLEQSKVVKGMVFGREPDGTIKSARKAKVGVFSCPIDVSQTETKGTVLLKNAQEMVDYTKGEEERVGLPLRNCMILVCVWSLLVPPLATWPFTTSTASTFW